jgi:hypothetical protein
VYVREGKIAALRTARMQLDALSRERERERELDTPFEIVG